jgi:hypothetical protein
MPGDAVLVAQDWGRWETMRRLVRAWALISVAGVFGWAFQLFLQLVGGGTGPGPGVVALIIVIAVSAFPGVVVGYVLGRRLWMKCGTTGTYRRKVRSGLATGLAMIPLFIVVLGQFVLRFVPLPIILGVGVGLFTVLSTIVLGIVSFEWRAACRFWYGPMPTRQKPEWIEVRAVRLPRGAPR